jgi:hypothetical protein
VYVSKMQWKYCIFRRVDSMEIEKQILKSIKEAYDHNNGFLFQELYIQQKWEPTVHYIKKTFGTFSNAIVAAGLEIKFIQQHEVVKQYEIPLKVIRYLITICPFKNFITRFNTSVFINQTIIPELKKYYLENQKQYNKYKSDPDYLPITAVSKTTGKSINALKSEIDNGVWEGYVVSIPKYQKSDYHYNDFENNYFFRRTVFGDSERVKQAKEEIIKSLNIAYEENEGLLAKHIYQKQGWRPSVTSIQNYFGGFNNALKAAGIEVKYLRRQEIADKYDIPRRSVDYLLTQEPFKKHTIIYDDIIYVNKSIIHKLKDFYLEYKDRYYRFNSDTEYLPIMNVVRLLNEDYKEVIKQIEEGDWEGWYISFPKYQKDHADNTDLHYFFKKSALKDYDSLEGIAAKSGIISNTALRDYANKDLLPKKAKLKGTRLYHVDTVIKAIPAIKENQLNVKIEKINNLQRPSFEYLSDYQQGLILKYIKFRENGGVINFNGYKTKSYIHNPQKTLKDLKSKISHFMLELILERCDISLSIEEFKSLDSIPEKFNADKFDIFSINHEDFFVFSKAKTFKTIRHYYHSLRPFYYYLLQTKESEAVLSDKRFREFLRLKINATNFLNQFPDRELSVKISKRSKKREKSFLSREQMVKVKELMLKCPFSRDKLKNVTMWQSCCTFAIRPEELHHVRIEYFLLDGYGFLKLNERGWGILDLPEEASKKGVSPSHEFYKTPIPPETVKQLNHYLEYLYKKQGSNNPRGKGFLFRPHYLYPEYQYKSGIKKDFLKRIRSDLTFLSPQQREDFILKAGRHSLNNLIDGYEVDLPDKSLNGRVQKIAADYQMRHRPNVAALYTASSSTQKRDMGEDHYTDMISEDSFYKVLNYTINFPWNLKELEIWEIKNGYREFTTNNSNEVAATSEEEVNNHADNELLQKLEEKFKKLKKTRPKEVSVSQWMKDIKKLEKEIKLLKTL